MCIPSKMSPKRAKQQLEEKGVEKRRIHLRPTTTYSKLTIRKKIEVAEALVIPYFALFLHYSGWPLSLVRVQIENSKNKPVSHV